MQRYNINNRLAYLSGGVQSLGGMWPSAAAAGWWDIAGETCVAAYQAIGAASQAASYVNLANPGTYDLTASGSFSWDTSTGWAVSSGSSMQLSSGVTFANTNYTAFVRFSGATNPWAWNAPLRSTSATFLISNAPNGARRQYTNGNSTGNIKTNVSAGVMGIAGLTCYLDGVEDATIASGGSVSGTLILGNGWYGNTTPVVIQAAVVYSTTLDAAQAATLSSAMAAL